MKFFKRNWFDILLIMQWIFLCINEMIDDVPTNDIKVLSLFSLIIIYNIGIILLHEASWKRNQSNNEEE